MSRIILGVTLSFATVLSLPVVAQRGGGGSRGGGASTGSASQGTHVDPLAVSPGLPTSPNIHHASEEGKVEFRSETVLIQVPTVVVDKSGAHVHNLAKEKFHIFENGKEQKIATMEEIVSVPAPPSAPALRPGVFTNALEGGKAHNATLIALDTVNTPFLDQAYGRQQLIKFLSQNVDPNQPIAMVMITSKGLKVVQSLSSDPGTLVKILKKLSGEISDNDMIGIDTRASAAAINSTYPLSDLNGGLFQPLSASLTNGLLDDFVSNGDVLYAQFRQDDAIETTMQAFLGIAWTLSGVEGRKTMLWATGGFPFTMDSPGALPGGRLSALYERAMQALNDAQVVIYPVDIRGLVNNSPIADAKVRRTPNNIQFTQRAWLQQSTLDTLVQFAQMTGGRAFYNTNDVAGSFKKAIDDASSYYMLTYYLDTKNQKSDWRKLKVTVDEKDIEVRSRTGFLVTNTTMNPTLTSQADLKYAVTAPFDATGIPFEVRLRGETAEGDKKRVAFGLQIPSSQVTFDGERNAFDLDFVAVANKDGNVIASMSQPVKGALSPENLAKVKSSGVLYSSSLVLAPGSYQLKVIVRDNLSGKMGSVSAPLTVD